MKSTSRLVLIAVVSAAMTAGFAFEAAAKVKPKNFGAVHQTVCSVAIDPAGNPHVAYQGTDDHLYHARFDGRRWQHELVDGKSTCGQGNSIAIDAQGHIHIMYGAERVTGSIYTSPLVYAYFNGTSWQVTDLDMEGWGAHMQLDASGHPHILFLTGMLGISYTKFDGVTWQTEDTGLTGGWYSSGLVVDNEGHAHISYAVNYSGCFYATNKSGSWESTNLVASTAAATAIGLTPEGLPRVLIGNGSMLTYFSYDGTNWTNETVADFNDADPNIQASIGTQIAMAMDAKGRPRFLVPVYLSSGNYYANVSGFVFDDGAGWNGMLVDSKNTGFYPSIALDTKGVAYGTYCGASNDSYAKAKWVRIALPDLTGTWSNVTVTATGGVSTVTGILTVSNHGPEKADKTTATLWLSDDEIINASDESLSVALRVKSVKPGASVTIPVRFQYNGALTGKHLGAVIDPDMLTYDNNLLDNIVTTLLP